MRFLPIVFATHEFDGAALYANEHDGLPNYNETKKNIYKFHHPPPKKVAIYSFVTPYLLSPRRRRRRRHPQHHHYHMLRNCGCGGMGIERREVGGRRTLEGDAF